MLAAGARRALLAEITKMEAQLAGGSAKWSHVLKSMRSVGSFKLSHSLKSKLRRLSGSGRFPLARPPALPPDDAHGLQA